jgi:hypothetical protein
MMYLFFVTAVSLAIACTFAYIYYNKYREEEHLKNVYKNEKIPKEKIISDRDVDSAVDMLRQKKYLSVSDRNFIINIIIKNHRL